MVDYLSMVSGQVGIPTWALIIIIIWSGIWKLLAMWKAARKNSILWFIILGLVNTIGFLEILYIYVFSEMDKKEKSKNKKSKKK